jgi:cardiolipin synthase
LRALPNLITLGRLLSAPVLAWLLIQNRFFWALNLIVLAGVSDWLDGYIARRLRLDGRLGVILDPLADKVLLVTLFVVLAVLRLIPLWMLALALGRDLAIVLGATLLRLLRGAHKFLPTMLGKVSTFFQIVLVLLSVCFAAFPYQIVLWLKTTALALSAAFTVLSGLEYVRIGIGMAGRDHNN